MFFNRIAYLPFINGIPSVIGYNVINLCAVIF